MSVATIARPARILTEADLRAAAPSVFATTPWGGMSHRYKLVPTIDVVGMLADKGFRPTQAFQSRTRIEGKGDFTKHLVRFRHDDALVPTTAEVPELVLTNSHDGTSAYKFFSGIWRIICSNGLIVQSSDFGSISVRHSGGSDFGDRVIDATYEVIEDAPRTLEKIEAWKGIELRDRHREAFAAAALELRDSPIEITPPQLLDRRRYEDRKTDLWTVANVVQENLIKGGVDGRSETTGKRRRTSAVASVGENLRLNRALWALTEKMAQLV